MTLPEVQDVIRSVIDDIVHATSKPPEGPGVSLFLAKQKLTAILQEWPPTDPQPK